MGLEKSPSLAPKPYLLGGLCSGRPSTIEKIIGLWQRDDTSLGYPVVCLEKILF